MNTHFSPAAQNRLRRGDYRSAQDPIKGLAPTVMVQRIGSMERRTHTASGYASLASSSDHRARARQLSASRYQMTISPDGAKFDPPCRSRSTALAPARVGVIGPRSGVPPRMPSKKDDSNQSASVSLCSSGPKRCTVDLSLNESESIITPPVNSPMEEKSTREAQLKIHSMLREDPTSERSRKAFRHTISRSDLTSHDVRDMLIQVDGLLDRVASFVSKSMPQVSFPVSALLPDSAHVKHNDVLDRVHIMTKLLDFAESTLQYTKRGRDVGVQTASRTEPASPYLTYRQPLRQTVIHPITTGLCDRFRSTGPARSLSAPRPLGGLVQPVYSMQHMRQGSTKSSPSASESARVTTSAQVEKKLGDWLNSIPIGNGASRGWDPDQLKELVDFAIQRHIGGKSAESIYKAYAEFQVDEASKER